MRFTSPPYAELVNENFSQPKKNSYKIKLNEFFSRNVQNHFMGEKIKKCSESMSTKESLKLSCNIHVGHLINV